MKKYAMILILSLFLASVAFNASASPIISVSLVNQDPDPAIAGDVVEMRIGVENRGDTAAENQMIEIVEGYPFEKVSGEDMVKNAGTIGAYDYGDDIKIVRFKIRINRDAIAGSYPLKIKTYEQGNAAAAGQQDITIEIKNRESAEVIYIDQVELLPGKITPMKFTINNVGSAPLRDLTFKWENEDSIVLPVGSSDTKYIKYIEVGEAAELVYNVIASGNANPDLYKLDLSLTYDDPLTGEEKEIATSAGVYVGGETDFDIAFSGSSNGETSFSVSNIGSVPASSVTVSIPRQQAWRVTGSDSVIIGNLNKGDYTIASFNLQQSGGTLQESNQQRTDNPDMQAIRQRMQQQGNESGVAFSGNTPVTLQVSYTDTRGGRHFIEKQVPIDSSAMRASVTTAQTGQGPGNFRQQQSSGRLKWVILAVLFVAAYFAHRKYKKERLKDPDYSYKKMILEFKEKIWKKKLKK